MAQRVAGCVSLMCEAYPAQHLLLWCTRSRVQHECSQHACDTSHQVPHASAACTLILNACQALRLPATLTHENLVVQFLLGRNNQGDVVQVDAGRSRPAHTTTHVCIVQGPPSSMHPRTLAAAASPAEFACRPALCSTVSSTQPGHCRLSSMLAEGCRHVSLLMQTRTQCCKDCNRQRCRRTCCRTLPTHWRTPWR